MTTERKPTREEVSQARAFWDSFLDPDEEAPLGVTVTKEESQPMASSEAHVHETKSPVFDQEGNSVVEQRDVRVHEESTTDIAEYTPNAPAVGALMEFTDEYDSFFSTSDLEMPRLNIIQSNTRAQNRGANDQNGQWHIVGLPGLSSVTVQVQGAAKRRSFGSFDNSDNYTEYCASADSITGVGKPGGDCASCPLSEFTEDAITGKRNAPRCVFRYEYVVWVHQYGTEALLTFQRASVPAAKRFNRILLQYKGQRAIRLGTKLASAGGNDFFTPTIIGSEPLDAN